MLNVGDVGLRSGLGIDLNKLKLTEGGIQMALGINFNTLPKPSLGSGLASDTKSNNECWGGWTQEWTWNWPEQGLNLLREV